MAGPLIVKTDGILPTGPVQLAFFDGLDARFEEKTCLTEEALIEQCAEAEALLVLREPITARVIAALPRLKVVARFGIGLDTVDVPAATAAGIAVTNVPDANIHEVASHTLAMILSLVRRLPQYDAAIRAGRWDPLGVGAGMTRIDRQTLGLVGFGKIGRLIATAARALGFRVVAHDPMLAAGAAEDGVSIVDLPTLIAEADIVSLHVPLTDATHHLIDAAMIARMRAGAILINASRGGLIDESALAEALVAGRLGGAGLDTFVNEPLEADSPLRRAPNLILTPHAAHFSRQSSQETMDKAFADVGRVLRGETPIYRANPTK
jgi:D-3-phosphoglycerate dehydrogenase / 2-oxoglutarate reductase